MVWVFTSRVLFEWMAQRFQGCSCLLSVFHLKSGAHNVCTAFSELDISAMATGSVGGRVKRALLSVTSKLVYFVRRVYFFRLALVGLEVSTLVSTSGRNVITIRCTRQCTRCPFAWMFVPHIISCKRPPHALQVNEALCEKNTRHYE